MGFGAIIGAATGITALGNALGIGRKKRERQQLAQQQQLNEHAAATNYKYGEQAAQNAFQRQMQAYNTSLRDNSASAQVERLQEAGLNPALMYGGGAAAGQAGQMVSGGQPSAGGAQAGQADSPVSKQMAAMNAAMTASQIKVNEATAEKLGAEADATSGYKADEAESVTGANNALEALRKTQEQAEQEGILSTRVQRAIAEVEFEVRDATKETEMGMAHEALRNLIIRTERENIAYTYEGATLRDRILTDGAMAVLMKEAEIRGIDARTQESLAKAVEAINWESRVPWTTQVANMSKSVGVKVWDILFGKKAQKEQE